MSAPGDPPGEHARHRRGQREGEAHPERPRELRRGRQHRAGRRVVAGAERGHEHGPGRDRERRADGGADRDAVEHPRTPGAVAQRPRRERARRRVPDLGERAAPRDRAPARGSRTRRPTPATSATGAANSSTSAIVCGSSSNPPIAIAGRATIAPTVRPPATNRMLAAANAAADSTARPSDEPGREVAPEEPGHHDRHGRQQADQRQGEGEPQQPALAGRAPIVHATGRLCSRAGPTLTMLTGTPDELLHAAHVCLRLLRQLLERLATVDLLVPALELLVDRARVVEHRLVRRHVVEGLPVRPVAGADLHGVEAAQHVELRDEDLGESVQPWRRTGRGTRRTTRIGADAR